MRSADDVRSVLLLHAAGRSSLAIARLTGIPRSTVRDWTAGRRPCALNNARGHGCSRCGGPRHEFQSLSPSYLYLLGLYLGDGCISVHPRQVYRLRIFLDLAYPEIVEECEAAIRAVVPTNKVSRQGRFSNYVNRAEFSHVEVSAYSRSWPCLFPQHGPGKKHERPIRLVGWQRELLRRHPERLLAGLIHSDGCRFINTGRHWRHARYSFSNRSLDIRRIFCDTCDRLGVRWTTAPHTVYVSRVVDVAKLDRFIGPKA